MPEEFNSTFLVLNFLDPSWNISGSELCQKSLFVKKKTEKSCEAIAFDKSQIYFSLWDTMETDEKNKIRLATFS